jgi:hypothetical protein
MSLQVYSRAKTQEDVTARMGYPPKPVLLEKRNAKH